MAQSFMVTINHQTAEYPYPLFIEVVSLHYAEKCYGSAMPRNYINKEVPEENFSYQIRRFRVVNCSGVRKLCVLLSLPRLRSQSCHTPTPCLFILKSCTRIISSPVKHDVSCIKFVSEKYFCSRRRKISLSIPSTSACLNYFVNICIHMFTHDFTY